MTLIDGICVTPNSYSGINIYIRHNLTTDKKLGEYGYAFH